LSKSQTKIHFTNSIFVLFRTKKVITVRLSFMLNKLPRCSKLRWRSYVRRTKMIVLIGTTFWKEQVYLQSLTTIKAVNLNIWIIWFEPPRHSAGPSVFNQANTPINNFYRSLNFHLSRLDLNSDNKWYLVVYQISSKCCTKLSKAFQFTMMELSSVFMKTKDSSATKDPSQQFKTKLLPRLTNFRARAAKKSSLKFRESKLLLEIKATKIQKM
jgi:hypothetical protein